MLELPWDVLTARFGKFLQLTYAVTTAVGFIIAAELFIIFSPGTAYDKRVLFSTWTSFLFGLKLNPFVVIALILLALILAYTLGYLSRILFISLIARFQALVSNTYQIVNYRRFHRNRSDPTQPRGGSPWLSWFDRGLWVPTINLLSSAHSFGRFV